METYDLQINEHPETTLQDYSLQTTIFLEVASYIIDAKLYSKSQSTHVSESQLK